jgi:hypothetical protein
MKHWNIWPIYHVIKSAKDECYRPKDKMVIHEYLVEVDLQALMDRTASRIIQAKKMSSVLFWTTYRKNLF